MKYTVIILMVLLVAACGQSSNHEDALQAQINGLQSKLDSAYKPGLGEFMSGIQVHHEKLWFAGQAQNWALAEFEINEIREAVSDINQYCADRPEVKSIPMIMPALDSVTNAIKARNVQQFDNGFTFLTTTCNSCHHATDHAFNVIKIPDTPPFSNQVFKVQ